MDEVIKLIESLKNSEIGNVVNSRMSEFDSLKNRESDVLFNELCFCLLTANFSASGGIKIQNAIGDGFHSLTREELSEKLAELGHRFPNMRADFIVEARRHRGNIRNVLDSFESDSERRNWFAENVKGLGMKEASHFLRNIGYKNVAIIDFHIIDLLVRYGLLEPLKNRSITAKKYLEIENILKDIAKTTNTSLGELDLYLWYDETGKILK